MAPTRGNHVGAPTAAAELRWATTATPAPSVGGGAQLCKGYPKVVEAQRGLGALPPRALGHCRAIRYDDPALVEGSARWWCHSEVVAYSDSLLEDGVDALVVAPLRRGRAALQPMVSG